MAKVLNITISLSQYYGHEVICEAELPDNWDTLSEEEQANFIDGCVSEAEAENIRINWEVNE